jgi:hypothetical protein
MQATEKDKMSPRTTKPQAPPTTEEKPKITWTFIPITTIPNRYHKSIYNDIIQDFIKSGHQQAQIETTTPLKTSSFRNIKHPNVKIIVRNKQIILIRHTATK